MFCGAAFCIIHIYGLLETFMVHRERCSNKKAAPSEGKGLLLKFKESLQQ